MKYNAKTNTITINKKNVSNKLIKTLSKEKIVEAIEILQIVQNNLPNNNFFVCMQIMALSRDSKLKGILYDTIDRYLALERDSTMTSVSLRDVIRHVTDLTYENDIDALRLSVRLQMVEELLYKCKTHLNNLESKEMKKAGLV